MTQKYNLGQWRGEETQKDSETLCFCLNAAVKNVIEINKPKVCSKRTFLC